MSTPDINDDDHVVCDNGYSSCEVDKAPDLPEDSQVGEVIDVIPAISRPKISLFIDGKPKFVRIQDLYNAALFLNNEKGKDAKANGKEFDPLQELSPVALVPKDTEQDKIVDARYKALGEFKRLCTTALLTLVTRSGVLKVSEHHIPVPGANLPQVSEAEVEVLFSRIDDMINLTDDDFEKAMLDPSVGLLKILGPILINAANNNGDVRGVFATIYFLAGKVQSGNKRVDLAELPWDDTKDEAGNVLSAGRKKVLTSRLDLLNLAASNLKNRKYVFERLRTKNSDAISVIDNAFVEKADKFNLNTYTRTQWYEILIGNLANTISLNESVKDKLMTHLINKLNAFTVEFMASGNSNAMAQSINNFVNELSQLNKKVVELRNVLAAEKEKQDSNPADSEGK